MDDSRFGDKVYTIKGVPVIHIKEASALIGICTQGLRHLIEEGGTVRRLKAYRDRSRLMIPTAEIEGFPFVERGRITLGKVIYHFHYVNGKWEKQVCQQCTYTNDYCLKRQIAEDLIVPAGDK